MRPTSPFRYSGNKGRILRYLESPPFDVKRVWEPFLGSGAYTLSHRLQGVGIDRDERVIKVWHWLQTATAEDILDLNRWYESQEGPVPVVEAPFPEGAQLYLRINVCSAMVGQWSGTTTYPQHSLPVAKTLRALPLIKNMEVRHGSFEEATPGPKDMVFFDPPYFGTKGNYKGEDFFDPSTILPVLEGWDCPILFTYGDGAQEWFPELEWEVSAVINVPRLRGGGTVQRKEWVAYLNWPQRMDTFHLFGG